jgi:hypothetical protein
MSKGRDGAVEAVRTLMVAKRSARHERTQAINQARALILTGPDELRARFAGKRAAALAEAVAARRPRPGDAAGYSLRVALREPRSRVLRGPAVRLVRSCGVLAQHVGQGGPHAQDQDREAGHESGDAPGRPGDVVLVHQVKRDLPGHAERERADRGPPGDAGSGR